MSRKSRRRAATPAERKAMTFPTGKAEFDWTDEDWAVAHLPQIRAAALVLQRDDKELETVVTEMVKTGMIPELFEQWSSVKEHLEGLIELLGAACTRTFIVLERIGYSRDKPSPEQPLH